MNGTDAYGNGGIAGVDPTSLEVPIPTLLTAIQESPWQTEYELEPGKLQCGLAGSPPTHLTALDGSTEIPLSPQLTEFYSYARSWRRSVLLHNVIDPDEYLDHLTDPRLDLPEVLKCEFDAPAVLVDAHGESLLPAQCALFWLDTLRGAIYNRAYFVFYPPTYSHTAGNAPDEPEIWGFENEHFRALDLRSYLASLVANYSAPIHATTERTTRTATGH